MKHTNEKPEKQRLVRYNQIIPAMFPDPKDQPSLRTFKTWVKRGYVPHVKVGRIMYFNPEECLRALMDGHTRTGDKPDSYRY